ncbi:MAG: hypothetical protein AAGA17_18610 [Actinomycetota bacterium]
MSALRRLVGSLIPGRRVRNRLGGLEGSVDELAQTMVPNVRAELLDRTAQVDLRVNDLRQAVDGERERLSERVDLLVDEATRRAEAADARLISEIQRLEARVEELEARLRDQRP